MYNLSKSPLEPPSSSTDLHPAVGWFRSEQATIHFASLQDFPISTIAPELPILPTSAESGLKQGGNWRWSSWYNKIQCFLNGKGVLQWYLDHLYTLSIPLPVILGYRAVVIYAAQNQLFVIFDIQIYWIANWPGQSLPAFCLFMQEDIYLTL